MRRAGIAKRVTTIMRGVISPKMKLSIPTDANSSRAIQSKEASIFSNTSTSLSGSGFKKFTCRANSDRLANIYPVAVGVLEHKRAQTVVLVLDALDDAQSVPLADRVERIDVVHHHVRDVE